MNQLGDTTRLTTTFKVGGVETDPTAVSLTVTKPDASAATYTYAGSSVTRDSAGVYHKDIALDQAGIWRWAWTGTGTAAGVDEGAFTVTQPLTSAPMLTTVDRVKQDLQETDTDDDDLIEMLIVQATAAIQAYTGREFAGPPTAETRTFDVPDWWNGRYGLEVGDLRSQPTAISIVDNQLGTVGSVTPASGAAYVYTDSETSRPIRRIRLLTASGLSLYGGYRVSVTGLWGWPTVPADVERACILTVREWMSKSDAEWGAPPSIATDPNVTFATPARFRFPFVVIQLLSPYREPAVA